jgi:hypothetical protein
MSGFVLAGDSSGAITLQANAVAGTNTITLPAETGTVLTTANTQIATKSLVLGVDQTWQNVAASRAVNTNYTNTTGRPIFVSVRMTQSSSGTASLIVDGVSIAGGATPNTPGNQTFGGIVPNGSVYQVTATSNTVSTWAELR